MAVLAFGSEPAQSWRVEHWLLDSLLAVVAARHAQDVEIVSTVERARMIGTLQIDQLPAGVAGKVVAALGSAAADVGAKRALAVDRGELRDGPSQESFRAAVQELAGLVASWRGR